MHCYTSPSYPHSYYLRFPFYLSTSDLYRLPNDLDLSTTKEGLDSLLRLVIGRTTDSTFLSFQVISVVVLVFE
jgi:hypothetical protein